MFAYLGLNFELQGKIYVFFIIFLFNQYIPVVIFFNNFPGFRTWIIQGECKKAKEDDDCLSRIIWYKSRDRDNHRRMLWVLLLKGLKRKSKYHLGSALNFSDWSMNDKFRISWICVQDTIASLHWHYILKIRDEENSC